MHTAHRVRCAGTTRVRTLHTVHWVQSAKDQRVWAGDCSQQYFVGPGGGDVLDEGVGVDRSDDAASCGVKVKLWRLELVQSHSDPYSAEATGKLYKDRSLSSALQTKEKLGCGRG